MITAMMMMPRIDPPTASAMVVESFVFAQTGAGRRKHALESSVAVRTKLTNLRFARFIRRCPRIRWHSATLAKLGPSCLPSPGIESPRLDGQSLAGLSHSEAGGGK